jgi:hypothetical protein
MNIPTRSLHDLGRGPEMSVPVPHAPPSPRAAPRAELVIVREIRPVSGRFPLTIMKWGAAT